MDGLLCGIGHENALVIGGIDRPFGNEPAAEEIQQRMPEFSAHEDEGKFLDLSGLDEGGDLEDLVQRAEAAGQGDEGVGILHQHQLPDEEMAERDPPIEVRVGPLFLG